MLQMFLCFQPNNAQGIDSWWSKSPKNGTRTFCIISVNPSIRIVLIIEEQKLVPSFFKIILQHIILLCNLSLWNMEWWSYHIQFYSLNIDLCDFFSLWLYKKTSIYEKFPAVRGGYYHSDRDPMVDSRTSSSSYIGTGSTVLSPKDVILKIDVLNRNGVPSMCSKNTQS